MAKLKFGATDFKLSSDHTTANLEAVGLVGTATVTRSRNATTEDTSSNDTEVRYVERKPEWSVAIEAVPDDADDANLDLLLAELDEQAFSIYFPSRTAGANKGLTIAGLCFTDEVVIEGDAGTGRGRVRATLRSVGSAMTVTRTP